MESRCQIEFWVGPISKFALVRIIVHQFKNLNLKIRMVFTQEFEFCFKFLFLDFWETWFLKLLKPSSLRFWKVDKIALLSLILANFGCSYLPWITIADIFWILSFKIGKQSIILLVFPRLQLFGGLCLFKILQKISKAMLILEATTVRYGQK